MLTLLNVAGRNISSVSSVTFEDALNGMCIYAHIHINTHSLLDIFSKGKIFFYLFIYFLKFNNERFNITM